MSGLEFEDGKTHVTDLSANFYSHFQTLKNDISTRLANLDPPGSKPNRDDVDFNSLSSDIIKLRKDLVDATPYLPTYDRRKCEQQLKELEESLSRYRAPKSKFSFKRKPVSASAISPAAPPDHTPSYHSSTSRPVTTNLTLSSQTSKRLSLASLLLPSNDSASVPRSSDITLTDLSTCIVDLFTQSGELKITALHARALHRVVLVIPPIEGSVLLHDVRDCIVVVGCHQFRMHDSSNTSVLLHAISTPIIEGSTHIRFGEYPPALQDATSMQNFFAHASQHKFAQDFDWIKPSASPNWSVLEHSPELVDKVVRLIDLRDGLDDGTDVPDILAQMLPQE